MQDRLLCHIRFDTHHQVHSMHNMLREHSDGYERHDLCYADAPFQVLHINHQNPLLRHDGNFDSSQVDL